jgi:hypothetical protein
MCVRMRDRRFVRRIDHLGQGSPAHRPLRRGIAVDAKDAPAEAFYLKYGFVTVEAWSWPRKMFLPLATARGLF